MKSLLDEGTRTKQAKQYSCIVTKGTQSGNSRLRPCMSWDGVCRLDPMGRGLVESQEGVSKALMRSTTMCFTLYRLQRPLTKGVQRGSSLALCSKGRIRQSHQGGVTAIVCLAACLERAFRLSKPLGDTTCQSSEPLDMQHHEHQRCSFARIIGLA